MTIKIDIRAVGDDTSHAAAQQVLIKRHCGSDIAYWDRKVKGGFSHEHYPRSESLKHNAILGLRGV